MVYKQFDHNAFMPMPIIGIIRGISHASLSCILPEFVNAGFSSIEITMNTHGATEMIKDAIKTHGEHLNVGAGTVCSMEDLNEALRAGANFIVTPVVIKEVIKECIKLGVPIFPGAFSPTEIYEAWSLGATMVKIFPASSLGPDFIKSVKAPFPNIKIMPTGGIETKDFPIYKKSGADAFGIGSPLFPNSLIEKGEWSKLSDHMKEFKKAWEAL
jgi:2-dehydro-3-deoxyphosphogluconate aldolase/(4S)-4-hydroxy-2-oxoglutarate aldolase